MSDYLARKALAEQLQRKKEAQFQAELEAKRLKDKQAALEEEERKKQRELQSKELRRKELLRANEAMVKASASKGQAGPSSQAGPSKVSASSSLAPSIAGRPSASEAKEIEYNPFAEDEYRPRPLSFSLEKPLIKRLEAKKAANDQKASSTSRANRGGTKSSDTKKRNTERKGSPPPLGRKAKAALAFAQSAKASKFDSVFSVRSIVDKAASPSNSPKLASGSLPRSAATPSKLSNGSSKVAASHINGNGKAREDPSLRPKADGMGRNGPRNTIGKAAAAHPSRRRRDSNDSTTTSEDSDRPAKRTRPDLDRPRGKERFGGGHSGPSQSAISAEIQALFRRPGQTRKEYDDYSDGSSDMEAGLSDVEEEELQAARIARREDELAEREEAERRRRKEEMKRQKGR
ncbi:hypothetical protein BD324DRAFT_461581 [Kockovaella imperatae]|uniref:SPT2 chromatin protein-domain-containing protein n=1 Tax=Kockovaella imperatae TaxID=4999 RepID=A0A1Y1UF70_9TREE|nr:hypothetical protein BD324DRAFT_461581 [Kockovaella imperatae]ORX36693.1 hypothetical protein BD324DRAFT_461581 [Kockovaella imperatae]